MSLLRVLSALSAVLIVGGCIARPLQDQVTRISTVELVAKIRNEARDAIRYKLIEYLSSPRYNSVEGIENNKTFVERLEQDDSTLSTKDISKLDAHSQALVRKYTDAVIAYNFDFDITEINTSDNSLALNGAFGIVKGVFNFTAKDENHRGNRRTFYVVDKFGELFNKRIDDPVRYTRANPLYPISGYTGLREVISTFVDLNEGDNLIAEKDKVGLLSDTLVFQTTLSGSVNPVFTLSPASSGISLKSISSTNSVSREDKHTLIVTLSLEVKPTTVDKEGKIHKPVTSRPGANLFIEQFYPTAASRAAISGTDLTKERALTELLNQVDQNNLRNLRLR